MTWTFQGEEVPGISSCPFCNSQSIEGTAEDSLDVEAGGMPDLESCQDGGWCVMCHNPECLARGPDRKEPADAIRWWNREMKSPHGPSALRRLIQL